MTLSSTFSTSSYHSSSNLDLNLTLPKLIKNALSKINSEILFNSYNQSKYADRILESACHFELYRAICKCLPPGIHVSPHIGKVFGNDGIVDLYIAKYKWAIDLLIDGDRLGEHHNRFKTGNNYLDNIFLKSCISIKFLS